jgi:drug/metabolite transporter (DMT)-like permease
MYLVPPVTAFIAWLLFAEPINAVTVFGTVMTVLGVALVVRPTTAQTAALRKE